MRTNTATLVRLALPAAGLSPALIAMGLSWLQSCVFNVFRARHKTTRSVLV